MIEKITAPTFKTTDGEKFESLRDAQEHEITLLIADQVPQLAEGHSKIVAAAIMVNRDKLVDVLTTKPNSKPRARAINGGRKKRTPKTLIDKNQPLLKSE